MVLLRSLCGYTQTIIFSILKNSGRIFTLQLHGLGKYSATIHLDYKNNNVIVKWLATDACSGKVWLVSLLDVRGASQQGYRRDANFCGAKSTDLVRAPGFTHGPHCLHFSQTVSHSDINPVQQGVTSENRWETVAASQHIHSDKNVQYLIKFSLPFKPP